MFAVDYMVGILDRSYTNNDLNRIFREYCRGSKQKVIVGWVYQNYIYGKRHKKAT